jgi:signal transduction histidine kinase
MATLPSLETQDIMAVEQARLPAEPYLAPMRPSAPTPLPEIVEALRTITVLEGLADDEYAWLALHGQERMGESGTLIFREGEPACHLNFILQGEIQVRRRRNGPALYIGRAGQMTGKLPFSRMKTYGGDGFTNGFVWVLDIEDSLFPAMLSAIPSMSQRCVSVLLDRVREVTRMEQQAEKLSALGKLAANLAHELNNPASAAQRSAASLFAELQQYGDRKYTLGAACVTSGTAAALHDWMQTRRAAVAEYCTLDPGASGNVMAAVDRETAILHWLELAPPIAESRFPLSHMDEFSATFPAEVVGPAMATLASSLRVERMTETIISSTARIFDLISAIKDYSYMDQAPIQDVDLPQSLEATLAMFGSRLLQIDVNLEFDPDLPRVHAYGSELNQVWTVLLENAIDAVEGVSGKRTLQIKTKLAGSMALVEIWDNGAGVPSELQSRIFEPFFTTKAPGSGLGLGLDTAQQIISRHSGFLRVESKPGQTCFQVRLPLDQAGAY